MDRCVHPSGTARSGGGDTGQKSLSGPCADGLPTACPVCCPPREAVRLLDRRCGGRNNPRTRQGRAGLHVARGVTAPCVTCTPHFHPTVPPPTAQNTDQLLLCQKVGPSPVRGAGLAAAHSHGRQRLNAGAILVLSTGKTDRCNGGQMGSTGPRVQAKGFRISFRETREAR